MLGRFILLAICLFHLYKSACFYNKQNYDAANFHLCTIILIWVLKSWSDNQNKKVNS